MITLHSTLLFRIQKPLENNTNDIANNKNAPPANWNILHLIQYTRTCNLCKTSAVKTRRVHCTNKSPERLPWQIQLRIFAVAAGNYSSRPTKGTPKPLHTAQPYNSIRTHIHTDTPRKPWSDRPFRHVNLILMASGRNSVVNVGMLWSWWTGKITTVPTGVGWTDVAKCALRASNDARRLLAKMHTWRVRNVWSVWRLFSVQHNAQRRINVACREF